MLLMRSVLRYMCPLPTERSSQPEAPPEPLSRASGYPMAPPSIFRTPPATSLSPPPTLSPLSWSTSNRDRSGAAFFVAAGQQEFLVRLKVMRPFVLDTD